MLFGDRIGVGVGIGVGIGVYCFVMMFVIVVEGEFACMLRSCRPLAIRRRVAGGGRWLRSRIDVVPGLRGPIVRWAAGPVDGLASQSIPSQVLLQFVESKALAKIVSSASKFGESAAKSPREFGHAFWSKDQQRHDENHHEL